MVGVMGREFGPVPLDADENVFQFGWLSLLDLLWLSQLIFAPRHCASPSPPLLRCLAPSVLAGGGAAIRLLLVFHHTLSICSPHGLCLLSLLKEKDRSTELTDEKILFYSGHYDMKHLEETDYMYSCQFISLNCETSNLSSITVRLCSFCWTGAPRDNCGILKCCEHHTFAFLTLANIS